MPKFESSRLNGVAVIAKTHTHTNIHTHILPNLGNTYNFFFAVIDNFNNQKSHILLLISLK